MGQNHRHQEFMHGVIAFPLPSAQASVVSSVVIFHLSIQDLHIYV